MPRANGGSVSYFIYLVHVTHGGVGKSLAEKTGGIYHSASSEVKTGPLSQDQMHHWNYAYKSGIKSYKILGALRKIQT